MARANEACTLGLLLFPLQVSSRLLPERTLYNPVCCRCTCKSQAQRLGHQRGWRGWAGCGQTESCLKVSGNAAYSSVASRPGGWGAQEGPRDHCWLWAGGTAVGCEGPCHLPAPAAMCGGLQGRPDAALGAWCTHSVVTWEQSNRCTPSGLLEPRTKSLNLFMHGLNIITISSVAGSMLVPALKEPYS